MVRRSAAILVFGALGVLSIEACSGKTYILPVCREGDPDPCSGASCAGGGGAGKSGTGGSAQTGGRGGQAGDTGSGSGSGGSAGSGAGGMVGDGGAAGTSAGFGGSAGSGGNVGIEQLVGKLDGFLIQYPCGDNPSTDDCNGGGYVAQGVHTHCMQTRLDANVDFDIGGTPGAIYSVALHFYGIVEPKNYGDSQKRESDQTPENLDSGATPPPFYIGDPGETYEASNYLTYEIHVYNENDVEVGTYFLNSDLHEGHYTYVLDYERTIQLVGAGRVRFRSFDGNCRIMKNCGTAPGYPCSGKARTVDLSGASPQPLIGEPPLGLDQPGLGYSDDHGGQWLFIDVTGFAQP